jgi:hypothetical protein
MLLIFCAPKRPANAAVEKRRHHAMLANELQMLNAKKDKCLKLPRAAGLRCPSLLALLVCHVPVPRRGSSELGTAVGARRLGSCARLLALVP